MNLEGWELINWLIGRSPIAGTKKLLVLEVYKTMENEKKQYLTHAGLLVEFVKMFPGIYLTGSHYFGGVKISSDYDFFINWKQATVDALRVFGFELVSDANYLDSMTKEVWGWRQEVTSPYIIHVQLLKSCTCLDIKLAAQHFLKSLPYPLSAQFANASKQQRTAIWNWAFTQVNHGVEIT